MSRFSRGPRRRPLSSLTPRDIDSLRENHDRELEFRENSGVEEDAFEKAQARWLERIDEDSAA